MQTGIDAAGYCAPIRAIHVTPIDERDGPNFPSKYAFWTSMSLRILKSAREYSADAPLPGSLSTKYTCTGILVLLRATADDVFNLHDARIRFQPVDNHHTAIYIVFSMRAQGT